MKREFMVCTRATLLLFAFICPSYSLSFQMNSIFPRSRRSSPSVLNVSASSSGHGESDEKSLINATMMKKEEFLASVKSCSKAVVFSALVDTASNAAAFVRSNSVSALPELSAFLPALWKFGFAGGIQYAASEYQKTGQVVLEDKKVFKDLCRTMAAVWELTAWMTTVAVLFDAMDTFHCKWAVRVAVFAAAALGRAASSISYRETNSFENNEEGRREGLLLVRTMAVCAGALLLEAVLSPLATFAGEAHWAEKGFVLSGIPTPFVLAKLLWWDLRRSTLKVVVATTTEKTEKTEMTTSKKNTVAAYASLLDAQKKFYLEAASMFKAENIFKGVFFLLMLVKMHATPLSQLVPLALVMTILWLM